MRFTLLPLIFSLCASLAYAAALSPATLSSLAARTPDIEEPAVYSDVVAYALPDGHRKIDFYLDGALAGSVVETDDGAEFLDETGAPFNLADLDSEPDLAKRQSRWEFARRFAKILAKWGKRAWDFFYCISLNVSWKCSDEFLDCATGGTAPWNCYSGLICAGVGAAKCR
ncbi:hypothetical protein N0V91_004523 [Didymella pomorum]|uniref:Uncharacterized protein n=1 Tax=Didymella pomorum TaxID=749634 RepID=A0A9W8ZIG9_9PLEO|nr:hypothetical protein N0V91_004523 [Didymella pomorum]